MKKIIIGTVVLGMAMVSTGCASTSEKMASNADKTESRLLARDEFMRASDAHRASGYERMEQSRMEQARSQSITSSNNSQPTPAPKP